MPNHFMKLWKRGTALLLAGVLLFSNLSSSLAFAESTPSQETTEATAETAETADTASLSEQAQAFVEAVKALDRDSMVAASNDWGLAHQAWMANLDNAVLESKLNEAIAVQEEACAPLYAAEDLYTFTYYLLKVGFIPPLRAHSALRKSGSCRCRNRR